LLASCCDQLITHPNVVNASDINELPANAHYVEGSVLCRLLMMALEDAGLDGQTEKTGVVLGTAMAESLQMEKIWESHQKKNQPDHENNSRVIFPDQDINETVAAAFHLQGPSHLVSTTCAAGNHAIAWASDLLKTGAADAMLAVGADTISYVDLLGFSRLLLQAPECCQPFDLHRKGTILSEGAGALVLEPLNLAKRRGAEILAEVAGYGLSCDAAGPFDSRVKDIESLVIAAERTFQEAQCSPDEIEYISAHGSGTRLNDSKETLFIKTILGERAYKVPISSIKSMLGHAQGAASSFEAIACVLSFKHDILYPTINYKTLDPQCDLDYVPNEARLCRVNTIMSNAFGVGGNNAIVIFRRWLGK
ncbi:MAG: DUF3326 domain-containing protein, partial [Calditrichaeota bacterium]|nr:DUF3326 domain-containing protein [Calditrichota bacterium]